MQKRLSRKRALLILSSLLCFYAGMQLPQRFSITVSDSLKYSLFFLTSLQDSKTIIRKGDYVLFTLSDRPLIQKVLSESWKNEPHAARFLQNRELYFIKEVVCTPGDWFRNDGEDFYCNSDYLGRAKSLSLNHSPLEHFTFNGKVPEGRLAAFGHSRDSFDSRYFGFMTQKEVRSIAWPVW